MAQHWRGEKCHEELTIVMVQSSGSKDGDEVGLSYGVGGKVRMNEVGVWL